MKVDQDAWLHDPQVREMVHQELGTGSGYVELTEDGEVVAVLSVPKSPLPPTDEEREAYERGKAEGRAEERAEVVAWLPTSAGHPGGVIRAEVESLARAVGRSEHSTSGDVLGERELERLRQRVADLEGACCPCCGWGLGKGRPAERPGATDRPRRAR